MALQYWIIQHISVIATISQFMFTIDAAGCPDNPSHTTHTENYKGHCYQFVNTEKYWTDAQKFCLENNGGLVQIPDSGTNDFITSTLASLSSWNNKGVWIGLTDKGEELKWKWATNMEGDYIPLESGAWANWGHGHPEGSLHSLRDCVRMVRKDSWKWHETFCSTFNWKYRFICQYELPPIVLNPERHHLAAKPPQPNSTTKQPDVTYNTNVEADVISDGDKDLASRQTDDVVVDREESMEKGVAAASADNRRTQIWAISCACAGVVAFVCIVLVMMLMKRRRSKREDGSNFSNNPMYDDKIEIKPTKRAPENAYERTCPKDSNVIHQQQKGVIDVEDPEDQYLKPKSLSNITELYLTTNASSSMKLADDSTFCKGIQENGIGVFQDTEYEIPIDNHIYAEIPIKGAEN